LFRAIKNPILLACVFAAASSSQSGPAFRSGVELVVLPCTVVDASGVPVRDLTRDEFRVTDNGVRRIVENLWLDSDAPLTLGVIVDASESQHEQLAEHRQTTLDLLDRILRPGDSIFVVSVNQDIRSWVDVTDSPSTLRKQMAASPGELLGEPCPQHQVLPGVRLTSACGSSPLWNAIYEAARLKLRPRTGNKALLILTDGFDSGSTRSWPQAVQEVQRADATVYAIQYRSKFGGSFAPDLYRLVEAAGGACFRAPDGAYGPIVSRIETDLRRRYVLGFRPEKLSGKLRHDVQVEVTRPLLTVRARKTYFEQ